MYTVCCCTLMFHQPKLLHISSNLYCGVLLQCGVIQPLSQTQMAWVEMAKDKGLHAALLELARDQNTTDKYAPLLLRNWLRQHEAYKRVQSSRGAAAAAAALTEAPESWVEVASSEGLEAAVHKYANSKHIRHKAAYERLQRWVNLAADFSKVGVNDQN